MGKKKRNIYEQQKWERGIAHDRAPLIERWFPNLSGLVIDMTFKNPDWGKDPRPRQRSYGPEHRAFFEIECTDRECVSGGFDLSKAVSQLVSSGNTESSGTITCMGWQDVERVGQYRCLLEMTYKITATYVDHTNGTTE